MFNGKTHYFYGLWPCSIAMLNCQITMENQHAVNGKTHIISTGPFSIAILNYQRVPLICWEPLSGSTGLSKL